MEPTMDKQQHELEMSRFSLSISPSLRLISFVTAAIWYLGLFAALLMIFLTGAVLFGVNPENLHISLPVTIDLVQGGEDHEFIPYEDRPTLTVIEGTAKVNLPPPGRWPSLGMVAAASSFLALFLWTIHLFRQILKTVKAGDPFNELNPKRIRTIGWIHLIGGPLAGLSFYIQGWLIRSHFGSFWKTIEKNYGAEVRFDLFEEFILLGIILLVVAQIFDFAMKLKREQELTV